MAKKERMGTVDVPRWWLDRAMALLDATPQTQEEIARLASAHAGRKSPWDGSAISRFKTGQGRTIDLTNALSSVLGIPRPFFTAPSEGTANIIFEIVRQELVHLDEKTTKVAAINKRVDEEIRHTVVDRHKASEVVSADYGKSDGGRRRTGGARRGRS